MALIGWFGLSFFMQFHVGAIPETPDFRPVSPWQSMREPQPWLMQMLALPIGIAMAGVVGFLWLVLTPLRDTSWTLSIPGFLLSFVGIVVVHELIHAVVHPAAGLSPHSVLGVWPSRGLFYAAYTGELSRNRFIWILLMPLLVMSWLPLAVAAAGQMASGWAVYISTLNALLACGDVLGAGMVWWQVPKSATVRNQGWQTYWRDDSATVASPA